MKKIVFATAVLVGAAGYFLTRKKTQRPESKRALEQTHHLTQVFSKAKQHALNS